jgi:transposase
LALIWHDGYRGAESTVRGYVGQRRRGLRQPQVCRPLLFEAGENGQVDWFEAKVIIAGQRLIVHVFLLRLNYSRAAFAMAFPFEKQEVFFEGHVQAFHFLGGAPRRLTYDNLKAAVFRILEGHNRQEQEALVTFRSYYLFKSFYCTPGQGHEKGGVESGVGFSRRNFLVPLPEVDSFEELNAFLRQQCLADMQRRVKGQPTTIQEAAWYIIARLMTAQQVQAGAALAGESPQGVLAFGGTVVQPGLAQQRDLGGDLEHLGIAHRPEPLERVPAVPDRRRFLSPDHAI